MSDRARDAAATLARLGLDATAIAAGGLAAADLTSILAGPDGSALAAALGDLATPEAATLLVALEPAASGRVRKEIRRALYRLRQRGVSVPEPPSAPPPSPARSGLEPEGFLSAFDARGDRLLWLLRPLAEGGALAVTATVNEPDGLRGLHVVETTRKQLRAGRRRMEAAGVRLVTADWRAIDALLVEAHERAGAREPERDYLRVRPRITAEPPRPAAEPVPTRVVPPAAEEHPALVAGSGALLEQPEIASWYPTPEAAAPFVAEIASVRESPLVLSRVAQEERVREVLGRAATTLFPAAPLARRLRGTAYVLAETGRAAAARQALAVAALLADRPAAALDVPFVALLVERAVGALLAESTAREEETRKTSLVVTPGQYLRDRSSSRPGRTRA